MNREFKVGRDLGERAVGASDSGPSLPSCSSSSPRARGLPVSTSPVRRRHADQGRGRDHAAHPRVGGGAGGRPARGEGDGAERRRHGGPIGFTIRPHHDRSGAHHRLRVVGLQPTTVAIGGAGTGSSSGWRTADARQRLRRNRAPRARPFRVAERIRLQGGVLAGQIEGVVVDSGTALHHSREAQDKVSIPNGVVLNCAVVPLREPSAVDVRACLRPEVRPSDLQDHLERTLATPTRSAPQIHSRSSSRKRSSFG